MTLKTRAKRTDTGIEFDFEPDCYAHGVASHRIGLARRDSPFPPDERSDFWQSWVAGWDTAHALAVRPTSRQCQTNDWCVRNDGHDGRCVDLHQIQ